MTNAIALPTIDTFRNRVTHCDVMTLLASLPSSSVNTIITSPPYFGLRDYDEDGQIGQEDTPEAFIERMVEVFHEARRVLRDDGTLWLNLGDSYSKSTTGRKDTAAGRRINGKPISRKVQPARHMEVSGMPSKNLLGIPWRTALALQADGWILRCDLIWHKPRTMPESVKDRPSKAHEYVFLLAKSPKYFYDIDAIREPFSEATIPRYLRGVSETNKWQAGAPGSKPHAISQPRQNRRKDHPAASGSAGSGFDGHSGVFGDDGRPLINPLGTNKRTVWSVNPQPFSEAHFATFPPDLIKPMILAGCPQSGIVLDPFMGSGTTGLVARRLGRDYIGCDLNADYCEMAQRRIDAEDPTKPKQVSPDEIQLSLFDGQNI